MSIVDLPRSSAALTATEQRLVDAALRCVARWGVGKTTLDDIAREAGCSRATAYRAFPGGREALMEAVAAHECAVAFATVAEAATSAADPSLEGRLVAGVTAAARLAGSHPALQFLLAHEPEVLLPRLAFAEMDVVLSTASRRLSPLLAEWLDTEDAARAVEWLARLVISCACSPHAAFDLTDPDITRRLVRTFVLPGLPSAARA